MPTRKTYKLNAAFILGQLEERGMNQSDLAKRVGRDPSLITGYLKNGKSAEARTVRRIAKVLNTSVRAVKTTLTDEDAKAPPAKYVQLTFRVHIWDSPITRSLIESLLTAISNALGFKSPVITYETHREGSLFVTAHSNMQVFSAFLGYFFSHLDNGLIETGKFGSIGLVWKHGHLLGIELPKRTLRLTCLPPHRAPRQYKPHAPAYTVEQVCYFHYRLRTNYVTYERSSDGSLLISAREDRDAVPDPSFSPVFAW